MDDRLRAGVLLRYVTSLSGQLSLAIPSWVGAMSTGEWRWLRHAPLGKKELVLRSSTSCYQDCWHTSQVDVK